MDAYDYEKIDKEILRKIERKINRNKYKKDGKQDNFKPKVFKNKKKYIRKKKNEEDPMDQFYNEQAEILQEILDFERAAEHREIEWY